SSTVLQGTRFDTSGNVLGTAAQALVTTQLGTGATQPRTTFDGRDFVLAWHEGPFTSQVDIKALRIHPDGTLMDPTPLPIAVSPEREKGVALASDGQGRTLFAYQRFDESPDVRAWRVRSVLLGGVLPGGSCTEADECASGFCVRGVCCDSADLVCRGPGLF